MPNAERTYPQLVPHFVGGREDRRLNSIVNTRCQGCASAVAVTDHHARERRRPRQVAVRRGADVEGGKLGYQSCAANPAVLSSMTRSEPRAPSVGRAVVLGCPD
jgi:hypothetical protein